MAITTPIAPPDRIPQECPNCHNAPWMQSEDRCTTCGREVPLYIAPSDEDSHDLYSVCPLISTQFHTIAGACPVCLGQGVIPIDMSDSLIGYLLNHLSEALPPPEPDHTTQPIGQPFARAVTLIFADPAQLRRICNDAGEHRVYVEPARSSNGTLSKGRLDVWVQDKSHPIGSTGRMRILRCGTASDVERYLYHHVAIAVDAWRPQPF